jgi:hypothetical protein
MPGVTDHKPTFVKLAHADHNYPIAAILGPIPWMMVLDPS